MRGEPKKHHPSHRPSDRWRLAFRDSMILLHLRLCEGAPILSTWAIIASWPKWPFHFFTGVFPVEVTGVESRLVHYFFLSDVFTAAINSAGVRSHLLRPTFLELSLSAFCLVAAFIAHALLVHGSYQVYWPLANSHRFVQVCTNGFGRCGRCLHGM
jgi:hypothetical protein